MRDRKNTKEGFIALLSIMIISVVLMIISVAQSFGGFYNRFNILNSEFKTRSFVLAHTCVNMTISKLIIDMSYVGNENIIVSGSNTCSIGNIQASGTEKIFKTSAMWQNSYTYIQVIVDTRDFSILSLEETPQ